jgi:hypothetical protein
MLCWTKVVVRQQVFTAHDVRCWASTPGVQQVIRFSDLMLCWTKVTVRQQVSHGRRWASTPGVQQVIRFSDLMLCWTKVAVRQQVFQVAAGHRHQVSSRSSDFRF